ncbi:hypothetical protein ACQ4PT_002545 [Festuca glaucescens]
MDRETSTSHDVLERTLLDESAEPTSLPLSLLQYITNHFSLDNQIGSGGFAVVYKGMVGKGMVAVKKLSNTFGLHENKFHEEVKCLINAKHKNIVRFLGYCAETQGKMQKFEGKLVMADQRNWLLCFEYVCNGSLDKHITDATCGLNWRERYRIIKGITEGLLFLHEIRILHLDLKPANILLDGHLVPKIADFGLSRCLGEDQTRAITENLSGTLGYMDPEYLRSRQIAFASDIYSLGVIIMEILTGAKRYLDDDYVVESWMNRLDASERRMQLEQEKKASHSDNNSLVKCFLEVHEKGKKATELFDKEIALTGNLELLDYLAEIAVECLNLDVDQRPSMTDVAERLVILNRSRRLHAQHISGDYADETDISNSFAEQNKEGQFWGVQDTDHPGVNISSSISTGLNKLNSLDIFNRKARMNSDTKSRRILEKSHFIKIFKKKQVMSMLKTNNLIEVDGFYEVYKGIVDTTVVAVKKLINGNMIENEHFENVVIIQSQVIHKNIHRLIGCCLEMDISMLVYEFLSKGSLDDILHSSSKVPLSLDMLLAIVAESAQGLAYLHSQAHCKILHGDVKPGNILLDENFMPKISDFGLSKLIASDNEHARCIIGDMSYMDPIYLQTGLLTEKSDVYSFGIVILEVISRKKASHSDDNSLVKSFLKVHEEGKKATDLFDKKIAVKGNLEILDYLAEIAVQCLNLNVDQRPTMTYVAERLLTLQRYRRSQVVGE